ncbi:hypothetical protein [Psychroserpens luteolus]|uniref:hypothetical protein n=1 Tax=Psychroserpens luteolus TaxID=2855840 RepID=UPI001E616251|nr:hypothetical protein [Psychroserpens luteolus]MCD2260663.1 hypothetical protein [Psychroserpens luteolus]
MKKLITLCIFAIALLFSTQDVTAQNTLEINEAANAKTKELRKKIKFEQNKMDDVYKAYQAYGIAYKKISGNLEGNKDRLEKIEKVLDEKLKTILTPEQYHNYLELIRGL